MTTDAVQIRRLHDFNELADHCERFVKDLAAEFETRKNHGNQAGGHVESCKTCTTAGCCYQLVTVTIFEAIPIARKLRREGKSTVEFRRLLRTIGEEMENTPHDHWFDLSRPCVFLTPDKRCSIYEVRPAPCSTHSVVDLPSTYCSPPSRKLPILRVDDRFFSEIMLRANANLQKELGLPEAPVLMGTLPKMVAVVLEAMTQPWNQFVKIIWEKGQLTEEVLNRQVTKADLAWLDQQLRTEGIDVEGNFQSEGETGTGQSRAERKGDNR
jgi:Fe-S-cluster containining protein